MFLSMRYATGSKGADHHVAPPALFYESRCRIRKSCDNSTDAPLWSPEPEICDSAPDNARIRDDDIALAFKGLVMAHEGDQDRFDQVYEEFKITNAGDRYLMILVAAWPGRHNRSWSFRSRIGELGSQIWIRQVI